MKTSLVIALLTMLSFLLGFVRDASIAAFFGGSRISDSLFLALTIPVFIENILGVALRDALIPHLQAVRAASATRFRAEIARIGRYLAACGMLLLVVLALFPEFWVGLLVPGWEGEAKSFASKIFLLGAITVPILIWAYFQAGVLNVRGRLSSPMWRSVFFNLGAIAAIFIWPEKPEAILFGMILGQFLHLIWMQHLISTPDTECPPQLKRRKDSGFLAAFLPMLVATFALQINVLAERFFGSWLNEGAISHLSYAYRLTTVPLILFSFSILTVVFPLLVTRHLEEDEAGFKRLVEKVFKLTLLILVPGTLFMVAFAEPVVRLFFGRGEFGPTDIAETGATAAAYAVGLSVLGLSLLGGRVLLALGRARMVMRSAILAAVTTLLLDAILFRPFGTVGIAMATSGGGLVQAIVLWKSIRASIHLELGWRDFMRWMGAAAPVGILLSFWIWDGLLGLFAGGIVTLGLFVGLLWLLGERELLSIRTLSSGKVG